MLIREDSSPIHPSPFSRRRTNTERLEAQLAEWTAIIARCRANATRSQVRAGRDFERAVDELQLLRNEAGAQVRLLKAAVDQDWETSAAALDRSWGPLRIAFQRAEARYCG